MVVWERMKQSAFHIEFERETDGRWIAEVPELPGVMAYGDSKEGAARRVYSIALRTLADSVERGRTFAAVSRLFVERELARG